MIVKITNTAAGNASATFNGISAPFVSASDAGCCDEGNCPAKGCTYGATVTINWIGNITWGLKWGGSPVIRITGGTFNQAMNFASLCGVSSSNQTFEVYDTAGTKMATLTLYCGDCPAAGGS